MTVKNTNKAIEIELNQSQLECLLQLQPDEALMPQLAREIISQALRASMGSMPGRKTKPVKGGGHDSN